MALISSLNPATTVGSHLVVKTTLTGSDTLTYKPGVKQTLYVQNLSASPLAVVIDGNGGTTVTPGNIGATINVATGYTINVPVGEIHRVSLANITAYLKGVVAVTGGTALTYAWIQEG